MEKNKLFSIKTLFLIGLSASIVNSKSIRNLQINSQLQCIGKKCVGTPLIDFITCS